MGRVSGWKRRAFVDRRFVRTESRRAYLWACILFWSILMYFVCERYVVSLGVVTDRSMLPTLPEGSYYLVNKYLYHVRRPQRGDVVVLRKNRYTGEQYVKRVVGLDGEILQIASGRVSINGRRLLEPYVAGVTLPDVGPVRIEPGSYFVMGDNRLESEDSRRFGSVPLAQIEGRITPGKLFSFF